MTENFLALEATAQTRAFLSGISYLDDSGREKVLDETKRILSKCAKPDAAMASRSVLVFGEVQSGKTLSFTTSMNLAKENGFKLFVVIAGTKKNLRDQTFDRLNKDLNATGNGAPITWKIQKNSKPGDADAVISALQTWEDPQVPSQYRVSPVLVVMKTAPSLKKLEHLITKISEETGMNIPVMFVDDEADQAGLNIADDKEMDKSRVNAALVSLRNACANHSYLMYTATAQALGLVDLDDEMSPDYVVVLDSGESYVSGKELFADRHEEYFLEIPGSELAAAESPNATKPPVATLKTSIHYFLVAACVAQKRGNPKPISMLIHPDRLKSSHSTYRIWVDKILSDVRDALVMDIPLEDRKSYFYSEFADALVQMEKTLHLDSVFETYDRDLAVEELIQLIPYWISQVQIREINSDRAANDIKTSDWGQWPLWILIGGAKLERGFTIENLAVTYMPRGKGGGMADTIQQRGRFFGHKRAYVDLLRGWFSYDTFNSFKEISEMEAHLRDQLIQVERDGISMKQWVRNLILVPGMVATRKAVISLKNLDIFTLKGGFRYFQRHIFGRLVTDPISYRHNNDLILPYLGVAVPFELDTRTSDQKNTSATIPLTDLIPLLDAWAMSSKDKGHLTGYLLGIQHFADTHAGSNAVLVFMDNLHPRKRSNATEEARTLDDVRVNNLHQGKDPRTTYLGDSHMQVSETITVQIHKVIPKLDDLELDPVLAIAICWPLENSKLVYIQKEPQSS